MCGIAGYIGTNQPSEGRIRGTITSLVHRGPDYQEYITRDTDGFGATLIHTRLSIIDYHPRSNQPFGRDGCWLVYNGEVYNHIELRKELELIGYRFTTNSDTEVLFYVLQEYGSAGLQRCEGMWAFAYYNERTQKLLLGRDRFGEKPLFFKRQDGLFFSSETKALSVLVGQNHEVSQQQLLRYLCNGYRSLNKSNAGFFSDVEIVPAGSVVTINSKGQSSCFRYWRPQPIPEIECTYADAVRETRSALEHSLEISLRSDTPIAFCLSGGVDSTALVSLSHRIFGYDIHAFTVANSDPRYDERRMVEESVNKLGIKHTWIPVEGGDFLDDLAKLIHIHNAPIATITFLAQWRMMKVISDLGYRVVVSGSGADEIFSGYYDHHLAYLSDLSGDSEHYPEALSNWQKMIVPTIRNPVLKDPNLFRCGKPTRDYLFNDLDLIADYLKVPWTESFSENNYCDGALRNRMMNELLHESVPVILHEDDLNAMSYSIENRSPFLNNALYETVRKVPFRHLIHQGMAKSLLRDAVRDVAPAHILDCSEKVGFNAALSSLLDLSDAVVREFILDEGPIYEIIRREKVETLLKDREAAYASSALLFSIINVKLFLENQVTTRP